MQTDQTNECPHCGRRVRADWRICPFCRESLRDLAKAAPAAPAVPPQVPARPAAVPENEPVLDLPSEPVTVPLPEEVPLPAPSPVSGGEEPATIQFSEAETPAAEVGVEPEIRYPVIERVNSGQTCPSCGSENESGGLFCTSCGRPLQSSGDQPAVPSISEPVPQPVLESVAAPVLTSVSETTSQQIPVLVPVPERAVPAPEQGVEPAAPAVPKAGFTAAGLWPRVPALIGYLGGLLLIIGSFTPMMRFTTAPVTTFNSDAGMGVLFIGFGLGALLLVTLKWFRELQVLGAVTLFLTGYIFWRITSTFAGLGSATAGSGLSLQWGWAVLVIGGVLLLSARLVALRRS